MGETTSIEWTNATWNPWMGCSKVSPGCDSCYMFAGMLRYGRDPETVQRTKDTTFYAPLRWKEPKRIFTCSWSDFFHKQADSWREQAWDVILQTPQHTYQILTKRPGLMVAWAKTHPWPRHVWAGTSVESQRYAPRLDVLARVPAEVRFVSVEPMLGPVDLRPWLWWGMGSRAGTLDWTIAGGESGPGARPAHPDWFRSVRDQCQVAGVPFFFKQRGEWSWDEENDEGIAVPKDWRSKPHLYRFLRSDGTVGSGYDGSDGVFVAKLGKKAAGALLDGREWREFPKQCIGHEHVALSCGVEVLR